MQSVQLLLFPRSSPLPTSSASLTFTPRTFSLKTSVMYKWLMPSLKSLRYSLESASGQAIDMSGGLNVTRNELLFESAVPLAKMYDGLLSTDDTFILQEFFVPSPNFQRYCDRVRPIYHDLKSPSNTAVMLLNTTIRFVRGDSITALPYARPPHDYFAFVLYYRIARTPAADEELGVFHNRFADAAIAENGTFYLPYRRCYTPHALHQAYPSLSSFVEKKQQIDPRAIFQNDWFQQYLAPLCAPAYFSPPPSPSLPPPPGGSGARSSSSYRALLRNPALRSRFEKLFLTNIFSLVDPCTVMRHMSSAAWDPDNETDYDIFKQIKRNTSR